MNVEKRRAIERHIISTFINDAIAAGYLINVEDCGDEEGSYVFEAHTADAEAVMPELFACDEDFIHVFTQDKKHVGFLHLVYGNTGWDVICDNTDSDRMNTILKNAEALAEQYADAQ